MALCCQTELGYGLHELSAAAVYGDSRQVMQHTNTPSLFIIKLKTASNNGGNVTIFQSINYN